MKGLSMTLRLPAFAFAAALALAAGSAAISQQRPAAAASAPAAAPWPQQASDLPADRDVRFGTLPNGMRYAIRRNATPPHQTSLRLRIGAGSLQEEDDQRGLAHFLEHMAFNGSTHVAEGEFVRRLERLGLRFGADTNASTDFTQTIYKLDLPESAAATIDEGLFLLREVADEATLAADAINRERGIIQSEERTRYSPAYRIFLDEISYLLPGQRLPDRIPIGAPEVIANARRDRFLAFYNAYYRPERATLVAVGDFNVDEMEAKIRARFSSWRGEGAAGRDPAPSTIPARTTQAHVFVEPGGPSRVELAWVRPPDLRPDTSAHRTERLIDQLAFAILNERLERIAATQSPAPYISAGGGRGEIADSVAITQVAAVVQAGEWRRGLTVIETEQRRLVEHGVTAAEIAREIDEIRTGLTAAVAGAATRQTAGLAEGLVASVERNDVFVAPADNLRLFEQAAPGLTPERVNEAARRLFAGEPILYMTSTTPVEGGDATLLAAYRETRAAPVGAGEVRQAAAWPYSGFGTPGTVAERHELAAEIGATAVRFANGVRLTVKKTDFADNQVMVSVRFGNGTLDLPAQGRNPAWALGPAFTTGGVGRMTYEDMREALTAHVYGVGLGINEDAFQLSGTTRPEDLPTQMQVLAAYLTDPGWREAAWNRFRALSGTIHDQFASTPGGVFARDASGLLRNGDRRFAFPGREEMAASVVADGRAVLDGPLANAPIEVIIVGDVDVEDAIRQTAATFGALPPRADAQRRADQVRFPAGTAEPLRFTHRGRADQGLAYIAWPTQGFYDDVRQARALNVLASVFQLRLIQKIREEQGTTYSPQAAHNPSEAYAGYGSLAARIEARPEALAGFLRDAEGIAADLRDHAIDADELQRARRPQVESIVRARAGNAWWLDSLEGVQTDARVAPKIRSQIADYEAVTPADLQRVARAFLLPGRAWKAIVVPEAPPAAPAP
ncbi:MAG: zinc protease [Sphingomonadales bacterium]|jgi:zinc protease|nr:zinc protease [Sphingomonadales bacterium]